MYTKPRLPDPVRRAAVRAVVTAALTLVQLMATVLCSLAGVWLAFPLVLATVASTVVATWGVLDVWVTRQVWVQRHGVISEPSSVARARARPFVPHPAQGPPGTPPSHHPHTAHNLSGGRTQSPGTPPDARR